MSLLFKTPRICHLSTLLGQDEVTHCFKASSELATFATKTIKALRVSACGKFRTETELYKRKGTERVEKKAV